MGIQRCNKCGTKFNYADVIDSFGWGYQPIICRKCGVKHNLKIRYIFIIAVILSLPIFFIGKISSLGTDIKLKILLGSLYIIYMAAAVGLYPFIIKYSISED